MFYFSIFVVAIYDISTKLLQWQANNMTNIVTVLVYRDTEEKTGKFESLFSEMILHIFITLIPQKWVKHYNNGLLVLHEKEKKLIGGNFMISSWIYLCVSSVNCNEVQCK